MKHQLQKSLRDIIPLKLSLARFKTCAKLHKCRDNTVVDWHRVDADPDPNPIVHADPTPSLTHVGKSQNNLCCNSHPWQSTLFYLSRLRHRVHGF